MIDYGDALGKIIDCRTGEVTKLSDNQEDLQDRIEYLESVLKSIKDLALCGGECYEDCDHCMQGQIHQLINEALKED